MDFSKELIEKLKTYFFNTFGIALTDDKASSYLFTLGSLGLILTNTDDYNESDPLIDPEEEALLRGLTPPGENRKAPDPDDKGTALVTQCPLSAININNNQVNQ